MSVDGQRCHYLSIYRRQTTIYMSSTVTEAASGQCAGPECRMTRLVAALSRNSRKLLTLLLVSSAACLLLLHSNADIEKQLQLGHQADMLVMFRFYYNWAVLGLLPKPKSASRSFAVCCPNFKLRLFTRPFTIITLRDSLSINRIGNTSYGTS